MVGRQRKDRRDVLTLKTRLNPRDKEGEPNLRKSELHLKNLASVTSDSFLQPDCRLLILSENVVQRYASLPGVLHMIELEKGKTGLGLSLAGNRDRSRMSVFVVGIDPNGAAGRDGHMLVGDELLEVFSGRLQATCHKHYLSKTSLNMQLIIYFYSIVD